MHSNKESCTHSKGNKHFLRNFCIIAELHFNHSHLNRKKEIKIILRFYSKKLEKRMPFLLTIAKPDSKAEVLLEAFSLARESWSLRQDKNPGVCSPSPDCDILPCKHITITYFRKKVRLKHQTQDPQTRHAIS